MKNLFFPVMLLAAAMIGCSEDNSSAVDTAATTADNADLVAINVYAGTTKGSDTITSTLEDSGFVELHIDDSGTISSTYTFQYTSSDWSQTDAAQLKWSEIVFPANFYSLHDGEAFDNLTFTSNVATYTDYEVTGVSTDHKDLVYHASKLEAIPVGGVLSAYHKHALSKIHLYAATDSNYLYIAKATLVNIDGEGTVTITPLAADATATDLGVSWSNGDSNNDSYIYHYIDSLTATAITSTDGSTTIINSDSVAPLMIIPQTTTAITSEEIATPNLTAGSYIEVIYYMTNSSGNPLVGFSAVSERTDADDYIDSDQTTTLYVKGAFPLGYTFEPNKEYNITLGLGAANTTGGILIVDAYVDKDGNEVTLTKKNDDGSDGDKTTVEIPDIDEGEDILSNVDALIDITVTSETWDDGGSTSVEYTE